MTKVFNKLSQDILNIERNEYITNSIIVAEKASNLIDKGLVSEEEIFNILDNHFSEMKELDIKHSPTFSASELCVLFDSLDNGDISKKEFDKLTKSLYIFLEDNNFEESRSLTGSVPMYDINKYINSKGTLSIDECINKSGIGDILADFSNAKTASKYLFLEKIDFITDKDTPLDIVSFCTELVTNFENMDSLDFCNYLLDGRDSFEDKYGFLENYEPKTNTKDLLLSYKREDSIGDKLLLEQSISEVLDKKYLEVDEINDLLNTVMTLSSYDIVSGDKNIDTFKTSELILLFDNLTSGDINKDTFEELTKTFSIELSSGGFEDEKDLVGQVKIYDIEKYFEEKDFDTSLNTQEIRKIVSKFSMVLDIGDTSDAGSMYFEIEENCKLINYLDTLQGAILTHNDNKLGELLTDDDLVEFLVDKDTEFKDIKYDYSNLKKETFETRREGLEI